MGLEPMVGVLQTPALPLGYVAGKQLSAIGFQPSAKTYRLKDWLRADC